MSLFARYLEPAQNMLVRLRAVDGAGSLLDADKLDGADWAAPLAIGSGTPAAATFTTLTVNTSQTMADAANVIFNATTGTKLGTATSQKLAFWNATPIVQPTSTTDLRTLLINVGLLATGGASPLNLNGGALTAASVTDSGLTSGRVTFASTAGLLADSANLTWNGTTFAVTGAATVSTTLGVTGLATLTAGLTTPAAIISTIATGTAPFTVASTTLVANLNADLLDGQEGTYYTGFATSAVSAHTAAVDPHGDRAYADSLIAANDAMVFKGVTDCSANPNYPAADRGHTYRVSVAGKIGGASGTNVEAGDLFICLTDGTASGTEAGVGASWTITQTNLDGAVIGPASATDGHFAQFDGASGKLIKGGTSWAVPASLGSTTPNAGAFTTLSATGVITSTQATGTAPFTVASTTVVSNLNVSQLLGSTWAAPGTIGSGTPSTGAFTTISGTTATLSSLTSGRVPFASTAGLLIDSDDFTYDTTTLSPKLIVGDGINNTTAASVRLNGPAASNRDLVFQTAGVSRWLFRANNTAEGGSNAGSDFTLTALTDAGSTIDVPLTILRVAAGAMTIVRPVSLSTASSGLTIAKTTGVTLTVSSTDAASITLAGGILLDGATTKTIKYTNGTANAAVAVTFGAVGPTGSTAGNQVGWVRVNIAGTDRYIPYW